MPTRRIAPVVTVSCLLLMGVEAAGAAGGRSSDDLRFELPRRERPRRIVRELLGPNRVRSLNLSRYEMELFGRDLTPELSVHREALEDAEDLLLSSFLRVSRERLERELRLKQRYDALRARRRGRDPDAVEPWRPERLGLRISGRTYLKDGDTLVGAKLRLRGLGPRLASRVSLGVAQELAGNNLRLELSLREFNWAASLIVHTDRRDQGESAELRIGATF